MPAEHLGFTELIDYAARAHELAPEVESHLFECAACGELAAEVDALIGGIRAAFRSAEVGGFVTDALLNQLNSDGVRVRTYTLAPGASVACAVWSGDELMAVRFRGDFASTRGITLRQRIAGTDIMQAAFELAPGQSEVIQTISASRVRQLPAVDIEVDITGDDGRVRATYVLRHQGSYAR